MRTQLNSLLQSYISSIRCLVALHIRAALALIHAKSCLYIHVYLYDISRYLHSIFRRMEYVLTHCRMLLAHA